MNCDRFAQELENQLLGRIVRAFLWKAGAPCSLKGNCLCSGNGRTSDTAIMECDVNTK